MGNIANFNNDGKFLSYNGYGIYLGYSDYNNITGNTLIENDECIVEDNCEGNNFENNDCIESNRNSFEINILISVISGGVIAVIVVAGILIRKRRASKDEVARYYKQKEQEKELKDDSD